MLDVASGNVEDDAEKACMVSTFSFPLVSPEPTYRCMGSVASQPNPIQRYGEPAIRRDTERSHTWLPTISSRLVFEASIAGRTGNQYCQPMPSFMLERWVNLAALQSRVGDTEKVY